MKKEPTFIDEIEYIEKYYNLERITVRHFDITLGYSYIAKHPDGSVYHSINEEQEIALDKLFMKLPCSSIRENDKFIDLNGDEWIVAWDCGEKVQLKKSNKIKIEEDFYQEELMVYIYKGFEYMSFDYRLYDKEGTKTYSKNVPSAYIKIIDNVVNACQKEQKHPELMLKKPDVWAQFK